MTEQEGTERDPMGPAILRGILIGVPVVLVGLSVGIWLITDLDFFESITTALLPGILLGAFGGGFAGMAATMKE
ncbi:MAG TPA: hypothetical protein VJ858_05660 [Acidimicrobiia bacterium]|jgi:hypothetical protein|nr:hypothetical protein [Acidimicrobiia bacterium]HJS72196.1 hypothetical protein [Acidimicrobiia bacterium]